MRPATSISLPRVNRWLIKLALHRKELRAWAWYDWASSAVWTTVISAIFPIYFYRVAGAGLSDSTATTRFATATTIGLVIVALLAPTLGTLADLAAMRKRMLACFMALGALATLGLYLVQRGDWLAALALFIAIEVGLSGGSTFYDALLPHVARQEEIDALSTTAYALGYLGGGLLLVLNLAWLVRPQWFGLPAGEALIDAQATLPARLAFVSAAIWWILFSVPLFRHVPEPPVQLEAHEPAARTSLTGAMHRVRTILVELRKHPHAFWMLLAFLIYSDGIGTIIRMAAIYGAEIGIGEGSLIGSILLVQFVGIPCAVLFGMLAKKIGPKQAIFLGLAGYIGIAIFAYFIKTAVHFLVLALGVAAVQGGTQALSRSLFASLIPKHKSAEFFSFFALSERFAGMLGPAAFAATIALTGSSRYAVLSVIFFFVAGGALLTRVDVDRGRAAAQKVETAPASSATAPQAPTDAAGNGPVV